LPAHSADLSDPKAVIRVLLALVTEAGGELRLKCSTYDSQDKKKMLTVDFDPQNGQLVLRATSFLGNPLLVNPEAHAWSQPVTAAPLERVRVEATAKAERRAVPDDEALAELEESANRNAEVAKAVEEGTTPLRLRTRR
jgi:hypothetical protein